MQTTSHRYVICYYGIYLQVLQGAGRLVLLERLLNLLLQNRGQRGVPSVPQQVVGLLKVRTPSSHLQTPLALLRRCITASATRNSAQSTCCHSRSAARNATNTRNPIWAALGRRGISIRKCTRAGQAPSRECLLLGSKRKKGQHPFHLEQRCLDGTATPGLCGQGSLCTLYALLSRGLDLVCDIRQVMAKQQSRDVPAPWL